MESDNNQKYIELLHHGRNIPKEVLFPKTENEKLKFARPDGKPFRIAVRGDCVCRRGVSLNSKLFENGYDLEVNEKATNRQFLETTAGRSCSLDRVREYVNVDSMSGSLKNYFQFQFSRSVLSMEDIDLIVMDTYSDMNFQMWRHKEEDWSMWTHPKFTDLEKLNSDFNNDGFIPFETAVDDAVKVIQAIRENNPDTPVLFMYQPVEYYRKLEARREFYRLPEAVASRLPYIYYASPLEVNDLGPADMGSCGPGQTLHFDGETYLKMIESAWQRGLSQHFTAGDGTSGKQLTTSYELPVQLVDFIPKKVSHSLACYRSGNQNCIKTCDATIEAAKKSFSQYIFHPELEELSEEPKRFTPMVIDLGNNFDFERFESEVKTFGKGARLRQKRKAIANGYYCKPFAWKLHIPDVFDINHSKENRSGGAMRGSYLRTVEEMGGVPDRMYSVVYPRCNLHWSLTFGAFLSDEDHMQGDIEVKERLVAYISLKRFGDIALYSQILCHGDHLSSGALTLLHHEVVQWLDSHRDQASEDLQYLMYGGAQNGGQSLYQWKRQAGFKPCQLVAVSSRQNMGELLSELQARTEN